MDPLSIGELTIRLTKLEEQVKTNKDADERQQRDANWHLHNGYDGSSRIDLMTQIRFRRIALKDQATINTDATAGIHYYVLLKGNRTLANPTGAAPGQRILFEFIQDSTGSRSVSLGSKFATGGFTVTLTATANRRDFMEVVYSDADDKFYVINFVKNYT